MDTLINFDEIKERIDEFQNGILGDRFSETPILLGLSYTLILLEWEGTPQILSDVFVYEENNQVSFDRTLTRLGYECNTQKITDTVQLQQMTFPCFITIQAQDYILINIHDGRCCMYDFENDNLFYQSTDSFSDAETCYVSNYSRLFREPSPESQDKNNWIKHSFYNYSDELKSLVRLSLVINLLGTIQPFFIMNVYAFALTAASHSTLYWLSAGAILVAFVEYSLKKQRMIILNTSGKELACHISYSVISKLLWLPYAMTSSAGTSSQMARLKDIDQFRQLVTNESSLSYFDLPFVLVFIVAIVAMSGIAGLVVIVGIIGMVIFSIYGRYAYAQATAKSSQANAMVSYQWNEVLSNTSAIQGLPLIGVLKSRFNAALSQRLNDSEHVSNTNNRIQSIGSSLIQVIGATGIVVAVLGVMDGTSDPGAMLALVILVWKALTPIMGIYNSLSKIETIKSSTGQINALMSINDDRLKMEKSPPLNQFQGQVTITALSHRYLGVSKGLTNLSFKVLPGQKLSVCSPAGGGKTTLLNILAGIEMRFQGEMLLDGYNSTQFNNFRYRNSVCYIPYDMHLYHGTIQANYTIYNGYTAAETINQMLAFFNLDTIFPDGPNTLINSELLNTLPDGVQRKLKLAIGLGDCLSKLIIIDEPFAGSEKESSHYLTSLFSGKLKNSSVIYTSNEKSMVATSDICLLLDHESAQKFFGSPDKVLSSKPDMLY
ncbi:hypothetical protein GCM10007916_27860 [Psychromonas marina]|uniref:ATP-binding cassette domain-containing protein n=1 Tax=Psychromonas marina TaxID=88364 RepID=A0ABQ6E2Z0_9GAMM|nr:ATP-binding cassette domain-containing protein [Psychromonas marina]GLS91716.1 hypothetical protein GCM10007916_27860 [Psychromonas marina]